MLNVMYDGMLQMILY